jgi:hypothetical protein
MYKHVDHTALGRFFVSLPPPVKSEFQGELSNREE